MSKAKRLTSAPPPAFFYLFMFPFFVASFPFDSFLPFLIFLLILLSTLPLSCYFSDIHLLPYSTCPPAYPLFLLSPLNH
jgi:hypothetical protein